MGQRMITDESASQVQPCEDFSAGLERFRSRDYAAALSTFRTLDEQSGYDELQDRYTSFHGLTRVLLGDASGIKLCRKAAAGNSQDAEVLYNLALAEYRLRNREGAYLALRRGLRLYPAHPGLLQLKADFGLRGRHGIFPFLSRDHFINRWIGRLLRGIRRPHTD